MLGEDDGLMDGWVGGLLDSCIGMAFVIAFADVLVVVCVLLVVVEVGFVTIDIVAFLDCGDFFLCDNGFFDIGIGEMTKLFLRLVHDVV